MVIASGGRSSKAKAREYKASGNKAMAAGAFQKAMRQYTKALELDPGNAILYSNRAATHFNMRQFAESLEDAESAILCDEKWWKAYKRKGLALIHMQRYEEAIEALEEGLMIVGKNAEMEKNLEFAKACQEQAQNLYILPEPHMMERLESVPVFIVTDEAGQPFFVTYEDGQQVCTFYFDKVDADATLKWIQEENPDIGSSARVIHITLNQAFTLAQETQKQYYEETTRAAVEEDIAAARAVAGKSKKGRSEHADDIDGDDDEGSAGNSKSPEDSGDDKDDKDDKDDGEEAQKAEDTHDAPAGSSVNADESEGGGGLVDEPLIDENAPLSFQFRPELRQVEVAVELLNKHPNPPVRPILRDPVAVKEAKAKAKAEAESHGKSESNVGEHSSSESKSEDISELTTEDAAKSDSLKTDTATDEITDGRKSDESSKDSAGNADANAPADKNDSDRDADEKSAVGEGEGKDLAGDSAGADDQDDVELTVENFNGIPVFQAKGLTLLQGDKRHIPLFCSKWDLEAAWDQLAASSTAGVSGKCEVEVGTLEDVLRRMSESKTGEYEHVIFVPSRESMEAIGQKFPLDDLSTRKPVAKPVVKKANYSRARQIKARGGTPEEIRAAIEEDLKLYRERQRMAEMVAQLNQTPVLEQAAASSGRSAAGSAAGLARRSAPVEKPLSGHARRSLQREERSKAAAKHSNTGSESSSKHRFSDLKAPVSGASPSSHVKDSTIGVTASDASS